MFRAGFEPATLCVWGTRDNRYTNETWMIFSSWRERQWFKLVFHKTKHSPPGGLEPPTFRLTAERASQLRHGGLLKSMVFDTKSHLLFATYIQYGSSPPGGECFALWKTILNHCLHPWYILLLLLTKLWQSFFRLAESNRGELAALFWYTPFKVFNQAV